MGFSEKTKRKIKARRESDQRTYSEVIQTTYTAGKHVRPKKKIKARRVKGLELAKKKV